MVFSETGDGWSVEFDDGVLVWEFLPGMDLSAFGDEAFPVYEDLLTERDVEAMVTVVELDDPFGQDVYEVWEQSARRASRAGIERWAIVAEGIKALSLHGKIDTGDVETLTTDDRTEAIDWVNGQ